MSLVRHMTSAAGGAALAACVFAIMGHATAPVVLDTDWPPREAPTASLTYSWACLETEPLYPWASGPWPAPPVAALIEPDDTIDHPGFDIEPRVDPAAIEPELVVLSTPLSMADPDVKRRWWRSVLSELLVEN